MIKNYYHITALTIGYYLIITPAYAYLDPGTLSIIFAFIVSIFTTTLFYIKQIIKFIKEKIFKKKANPKSD
tara:strand:- start:2809 stop:3021 length:213 start_codon:yes stop_codon:yes gene_type:complete